MSVNYGTRADVRRSLAPVGLGFCARAVGSAGTIREIPLEFTKPKIARASMRGKPAPRFDPNPIIRSDCRSRTLPHKARIESNLTGRGRPSATPCPDSPSGIGRLLLRSQRDDAGTLYGSTAADFGCPHSMVTNAVLCPANIGAGFIALESLFIAAWLGSAEVEAPLVGKGPRSGSSMSPSDARKSEIVAFAIDPAFDRPISRSFRWDFLNIERFGGVGSRRCTDAGRALR